MRFIPIYHSGQCGPERLVFVGGSKSKRKKNRRERGGGGKKVVDENIHLHISARVRGVIARLWLFAVD